MGVKRIAVHPGFNLKILVNDIAILKLDGSLAWSGKVRGEV